MFKVKDRQNSCVEPFEFLPAKDSEVYALGEALTYTDKVTKCGATAKPTAGTAVTLGTAGLSVTATTTSGVFTVTDVDEANGVCCGFFK